MGTGGGGGATKREGGGGGSLIPRKRGAETCSAMHKTFYPVLIGGGVACKTFRTCDLFPFCKPPLPTAPHN